MEEENNNNENNLKEENNEEEDPQITSSIENVIPMKQISHGWKVLQGFAKVRKIIKTTST